MPKAKNKKKKVLKPDSPKTARKFALSILGSDKPKKKKKETDKEYNDRYFKQLQKKKILMTEIKAKVRKETDDKTDNPMTKAEDKILGTYEEEMSEEIYALVKGKGMTDAEQTRLATKIEKKYLKLLREGKLKPKKIASSLKGEFIKKINKKKKKGKKKVIYTSKPTAKQPTFDSD